MSKSNLRVLSGQLIESDNLLTLEELSRAVHTDVETLTLMVEYELIHPKGQLPDTWVFDAVCLKRARKACRLQKDLELNFSGVGVILDLLDEVELLKKKMNRLEKYFDEE